MKDVKELNLTNNPGFVLNQIEKGNEFIDSNRSRWICPITGLEMNGVYKFYCLLTCGCVISERAYKSMQSTFKCLKCDQIYTDNDLIVLNPNDDDLMLNQDRYNARKSAAKISKQKTNNVVAVAEAKVETQVCTDDNKLEEIESLSASSKLSSSEHKKIHDVAGVEEKVCLDDKKVPENDHASSKISSIGHKRSHTQTEIGKKPVENSNKNDPKRAKSIQEDPNTSSIYKSLFTSSDKAKNQQKAHWVTFNPQYF